MDTGCFQVSHFLNLDRWPSIPTLMQPDGRFALDFWRTLQLHHFLQTLSSPTEYRKSPTPFESHCMEVGTLPRTLPTMYSILISPPEEFQHPGLIKWETDLEWSFTPDQGSFGLLLNPSYVCAFKSATIRYLTGDTIHHQS